jgi:hypothetical protein
MFAVDTSCQANNKDPNPRRVVIAHNNYLSKCSISYKIQSYFRHFSWNSSFTCFFSWNNLTSLKTWATGG